MTEQKRKTSRLAIVSFSFIVLSICSFLVFFISFGGYGLLMYISIILFSIFAVPGFFVGIVADCKICRNKDKLKGRVFSILGISLGFVFLIFTLALSLFYCFYVRPLMTDLACSGNMKVIGYSMRLYSHENSGEFPSPDSWSELLIKHADLQEEWLICRAAEKLGSEEKCHYAINPKADPNSAGRVVLLFETKGGWNQYGGKELLTTENHNNRGCSVLFNDSIVGFIRAEDINDLRRE